ncbi:MAG: zf-HC2 domain-containing protein [Thermoleophilaceae bacterium]|nr:zf-HC2 domain-containing protein [Thermoleophilaceae bacterium]
MSGCDHTRELLGGHVLGGLSDEETRLVEEHLEGCPRCGREYAELAGLPELLDLAGSADTEPEAPPQSLEEAVLDRFARERRGLAPPTRMPRRGLRVGAALAAAAAVALAALAIAGVFDSERAEAYGHVDMRGHGGGAWAELRSVRAGTEMKLRVWGLERARPGSYDVWCVAESGRWISGGSFDVDANGRAEVELTSAARAGQYHRMLVTRGRKDGRGVVLAGRVEY